MVTWQGPRGQSSGHKRLLTACSLPRTAVEYSMVWRTHTETHPVPFHRVGGTERSLLHATVF